MQRTPRGAGCHPPRGVFSHVGILAPDRVEQIVVLVHGQLQVSCVALERVVENGALQCADGVAQLLDDNIA